MPKPEVGETEKDYLKRCIPELIHEGRERNVAAAICYSYYRREGTEEKSPKPEKKKVSWETGNSPKPEKKNMTRETGKSKMTRKVAYCHLCLL